MVRLRTSTHGHVEGDQKTEGPKEPSWTKSRTLPNYRKWKSGIDHKEAEWAREKAQDTTQDTVKNL